MPHKSSNTPGRRKKNCTLIASSNVQEDLVVKTTTCLLGADAAKQPEGPSPWTVHLHQGQVHPVFTTTKARRWLTQIQV